MSAVIFKYRNSVEARTETGTLLLVRCKQVFAPYFTLTTNITFSKVQTLADTGFPPVSDVRFYCLFCFI